MLKKKDVCRLSSVSPATLDRWEAAGLFPKRIRLGTGRVAWWEAEVLEWLERQAQRPLDLSS
jgi:prophage regulatory protein